VQHSAGSTASQGGLNR